MTWKCLNESAAYIFHDHRYFVREGGGAYAVADWSMRLKDRPDTTDDGLLLLDTTRPVVVSLTGIQVPVTRADVDKSKTVVKSSLKQLDHLLSIFRSAGMMVTVEKSLADLLESLEGYITTNNHDAWEENAIADGRRYG